MNISIKQVSSDEKEILRNLLEKYNFEFSKWDKRDVNALGLYGYDWFDHYWTEDDRYAFFIMADEKLAGFAMINSYWYTKDNPRLRRGNKKAYSYRRSRQEKNSLLK